MNTPQQIAKHLRDVHYGGNWTCVNLKDSLGGITWEQATTKVHSFNTIAVLVYHINYYVGVVQKVLEGQPLQGKDTESFNCPPISSEEAWQAMLDKTWSDMEHLVTLIEQLPEQKLWETFVDEKYGTYYRNLQGMIEHTHYHLGQITLIRKLL